MAFVQPGQPGLHYKGNAAHPRCAVAPRHPLAPPHRSLRARLKSAAEKPATSAPPAPDPLNDFFSPHSFASFGFGQDVSEALAGALQISRPTTIQARTFAAILGGADCIVGAATGSGKTLAYLLPVVHMLKMAEEMSAAEGSAAAASVPVGRRARRPRAVVLVPTRELAAQVLAVAKALAHRMKFRAVGLIGGVGSLKQQKDKLAQGAVDVVVATTGRMLQHIEAFNVDVAEVEHVIIDEVDTMFDEGFGPEVDRILSTVRRRRAGADSNHVQYIAVGATHPKPAIELYNTSFPNAKWIEADLHRVPPRLEQRFVDVRSDTKAAELLALLGNVAGESGGALRGGRMIVFCNTVTSCRFVDHLLNEAGFATSCVHGDMPPERRDVSFREFKTASTQIMVCTDVAARGLDNLLVDHVVLFDFPTSPVEYLHRAGRTARAGASGVVTSLVTKRDTRLATTIMGATRDRLDALERVRVQRQEDTRRKEEAREAAMKNEEAEEEEEVEEQGDGRLGRGAAKKSGGGWNRGKKVGGRRSGRGGGWKAGPSSSSRETRTSGSQRGRPRTSGSPTSRPRRPAGRR